MNKVITLGVQLDTKQAQAQMNALQSTLEGTLAKANSSSFLSGPSKALTTATQAATDLQLKMQNAFNVDTGKLDLTKFNQSLQASGTNLNYYKNQLLALGPAGGQAFNQIARSIATADTKVVNSIGLIDKMKKRYSIFVFFLIEYQRCISYWRNRYESKVYRETGKRQGLD